MEQELYFKKTTWTDHGYKKTRVVIFSGDAMTIASKRAGAIDNRDGYGSPEAAARWVAKCDTLAEGGATHIVDGILGSQRITLEWLHYRPEGAAPDDHHGYCRPCVEVGSEPACIDGNVRLLRRVAKAARRIGRTPDRLGGLSNEDIESPDVVIQALRRMRVREVFPTVCGPESWDVEDVYTAPGA